MSNRYYDMLLETTMEKLQQTGEYDCAKHEEHYIKDCDECDEKWSSLKEDCKKKIEEEYD